MFILIGNTLVLGGDDATLLGSSLTLPPVLWTSCVASGPNKDNHPGSIRVMLSRHEIIVSTMTDSYRSVVAVITFL